MATTFSILMIGDVVAESGMIAVQNYLPGIIAEKKPQLVVVNGENALDGAGISRAELTRFAALGIHVVTGGNHIWEGPEAEFVLTSAQELLRPANYPASAPGHGSCLLHLEGQAVMVVSLQGRRFMGLLNCPFRCMDAILSSPSFDPHNTIVVIDFHAESTDEKEALAHYLDGRVSVLVGTHTHVQTADERILAQGLGYITDLGMTGPRDSVIGMNTGVCVERCLTQMPLKMEVAHGDARFSGALFVVDRESRRCVSVERIQR